MDKTNKSKWQVRLAAMIIFLLGFAAGSLAFNAYQKWSRPAPRGFEAMIESLQLNADQKTQVHQILADARAQLKAVRDESEPRLDDIRRQADERLQKVLTAEQWQKFQQMRDEMRNRGRRGREGRD